MSTKLLNYLAKSDLISQPVWEHWYEGEIEYAKPSILIELTEMNNKGHIVMTDFILRNGMKLIGFCSPQDASSIEYIQPVMLTDKGQISLFKDEGWTFSQKIKELQKLDLAWKNVFPLEYKTRIRCDGNYYEGIILDFNKGK
jgi:hypothetical protein